MVWYRYHTSNKKTKPFINACINNTACTIQDSLPAGPVPAAISDSPNDVLVRVLARQRGYNLSEPGPSTGTGTSQMAGPTTTGRGRGRGRGRSDGVVIVAG